VNLKCQENRRVLDRVKDPRAGCPFCIFGWSRGSLSDAQKKLLSSRTSEPHAGLQTCVFIGNLSATTSSHLP